MYISNKAKFLFLLSLQSSNGFTARPSFTSKRAVSCLSAGSGSGNEAAFSAFADTLEDDDYFAEEENEAVPSWQESLEEFLDPTTAVAKRQILLSDLLGSNDKIRSSVEEALRERKIDPLLTPTGKKIQDGTRAVARQLTNDILPTLSKTVSSRRTPSPPDDLPSLLPKIGSRIFDAVSTQARQKLEQLQQDISDPTRIPDRITRQTEEFAKEARNIFRETPEGLRGPAYTVAETGPGYEIREYEAYEAASTSMSKIGEEFSVEDLYRGGTAFNTLAAYLFGANEESKSMEMTSPVTTTSLGEMRFFLRKDGTMEGEFPAPLPQSPKFNERGSVQIVEIPPARLAVATFPGFVTDGEVQRQKDALLAGLDMDGVEIDVDHGSIVPHVIFQYNPPYTIPVLRRNEIAVQVRKDKVGVKLENEWEGDVEGEKGTVSEKAWEGDGEGEDSFPSDAETNV